MLCDPLSLPLLALLLQLDLVALPSWQAQLRGKKTWTVAPQPECEHICHTFNVTVNTGDLCESHKSHPYSHVCHIL